MSNGSVKINAVVRNDGRAFEECEKSVGWKSTHHTTNESVFLFRNNTTSPRRRDLLIFVERTMQARSKITV